jgi:hypothetical protein
MTLFLATRRWTSLASMSSTKRESAAGRGGERWRPSFSAYAILPESNLRMGRFHCSVERPYQSIS